MKRASLVPRFGKEVVLQAANLSNPEARFLVANYYTAQEMRKRNDMQLRHLGEKDGAPILPMLLNKSADSFAVIESEIMKGLQVYADSTQLGRWCQSNDGIGPVITSGLLAHLDITKAPTAGHFWSFAGLNPDMVWEKGQKRPYNADLRQICWHLGQCVKRLQKDKNAYYRQIYEVRKDYVVNKNETGMNAERAKTFRTRTPEVMALLKTGKLPAITIDSQACNYVAKMFLSHLHALMYWDHYGTPPVKPFAIAIMGHTHEIEIPNTHMFPGFAKAYYKGPLGDEIERRDRTANENIAQEEPKKASRRTRK